MWSVRSYKILRVRCLRCHYIPLIRVLAYMCERFFYISESYAHIYLIFNVATSLLKGKFGNIYILSYNIPVQTIVSPYDANCVTPLVYPTTDLDFIFLDNCLVWLKLLFFVTFTQPFFKRYYPAVVITKTRQNCTYSYVRKVFVKFVDVTLQMRFDTNLK